MSHLFPPSATLAGHAPPATPTPARERRIRALVVDDSVVMRSLITRILSSDPAIDVVGSARDGADALLKVAQLLPDLVTLDVEMPRMDGLEALRLLQAQHPRVRVIMCSSLTERGAAVTIDALLAGASDYVTKQAGSGTGSEAYEPLRVELLGKVAQLFWKGRGVTPPVASAPTFGAAGAAASGAAGLRAAPATTPSRPAARKARTPEVLAIGVSTGGPSALAEIMPLIPTGCPLSIVIVQHMPPFFTQLLAERLDRISGIAVREGVDGMQLAPGVAVIAPGNFHMRVVRRPDGAAIQLDQGEQENSCRPAVDVLFRSVAEVYGAAAIGVILTGMGQDGLLGAGALKARGAPVIVQDSQTSVVWGMPGAVAQAQLADEVLPLKEVIPSILRRL